ncbi:type II secretion system protein GspC [Vibrio sp. 10N.286.49.B3]|uniref:type II secretion system protein GspC n=1 Tax=Vibrio sp. 10N.286.49.B3 TaxID=1880855 RepID=UPI000C84953A|nr:type II secretion system protein GspC [Vibrio sp. 10N.286.49.B3]PMH46035.1 type II secretion system protein GspC [Vibrio sp. 10N.286.49.B3]
MKLNELGAQLNRFPRLARLIQNGPVLQQQSSFIITAILIASSAWVFGQVTWLNQSSQQSVSTWQPAKDGTAVVNQAGIDLSAVKSMNMFGVYKAKAEAPKVEKKPVVTDAPKTRLNLVLVGAVASSNDKRSLAVIANRGKQNTYGIGEEIDGTRAKLTSVLVDRIIIDNQGRHETLMLEGVDYNQRSQSQPAAKASRTSRTQSNNSAQSGDNLASIKQAITEDPQQIFQYVRLSQVKKEGSVVGYRVSPGKEADLFNSVGLQSGDIAVGLNGTDLTDPSAMGSILKEMNNLTELNLTVERNGQQHDIYIEF